MPRSFFGAPVPLAIALGLLGLGALFFREGRAAVEVWNASTAYSHCYLILPMALYLLWERRDVIATLSPRPAPGWALLAVPITLVWLVAERLGLMEGRQLAALAGIELLLLTVIGRTAFIALSGPLLFLFFLVPFGAFLTPALQHFTAVFSITGLNLLGIPNYSDQFTIETPAGVFFVAEACAGLRFLIAAVAFGVFFALLSYTSPARRVAFIAASIIVPIIANGFRALGIVVLGQVLGSAQAAAADHIVYGWVFFSAVMLLLIAVGQMFRDSPQATPAPVAVAPERRQAQAWQGAVLVVLILCAGPAFAALIDARATAPAVDLRGLLVGSGSCTVLAEPQGSTGNRLVTRFVCDGIRFDAQADVFPARSTASAMVSERRRITQEIGAENATITSLEAPDDAGLWTAVQTTDPNRLTAYASWVDGQPSPGGLSGRIKQARDSLLGTSSLPLLITVTAAEPAMALPSARKATLTALAGLVQAQVGLNERVAAASRVSTPSR